MFHNMKDQTTLWVVPLWVWRSSWPQALGLSSGPDLCLAQEVWPTPPGLNSTVSVSEMEKEMATHSSIFAGKIPWTEEPGALRSMGSQRVRQDWEMSTHRVKESRNHLNNLPCSLLPLEKTKTKWKDLWLLKVQGSIRKNLLSLRKSPQKLQFNPCKTCSWLCAHGSLRSHFL